MRDRVIGEVPGYRAVEDAACCCLISRTSQMPQRNPESLLVNDLCYTLALVYSTEIFYLDSVATR